MKHLFMVLVCVTLSAGPVLAARLPMASDLTADAAAIRQNDTPLMVMFSRDDCPYCDVVRERYLAPLIADPDVGVLVRVVNLGHETPLVDFSGRASTHTEFARSQGVDFVPTLRFFDAGGRMLVPDLVGLMLEDFYGWYLTNAIGEAQATIGQLAD